MIGAILWGWFRLSALLGISTLAFILISAALPLIITGGFHVDGFMDTMDALHSYQPRERKLEILRIPTLELFRDQVGGIRVDLCGGSFPDCGLSCAGSVLLWIFPVPLSEWPERGLLPFRKTDGMLYHLRVPHMSVG